LAKNLKLKIKNEQLAQALNLNKVKKPVTSSNEDEQKKIEEKAINDVAVQKAEETSEDKNKKIAKPVSKQTKEEAALAAAEPVKKKAIKATDLPSTFKDLKSSPSQPLPPKEEPVETKEEVVTKPTEEMLPKKQEEVAAIDQEKQAHLPPPSPVKKQPENLPIKDAKPDLSSAKKEVKPLKPFDEKEEVKHVKDPKAAVKRFENQKFDARDRQGLRDVEEGGWRRRRHAKSKGPKKIEPIVRPKSIKIKLPITVKDLSAAMKIKVSDLITKLFLQGIVMTINDYLEDETTVQLLGVDFDCEVTIDTSEEERLRITEHSISEEIKTSGEDILQSRAPVVTFMGHVDHGKTSLIDALRKSNIAAGEAGAITQHIGAFRCHSNSGDITVLDTPGHEAFKEMRMRGATVTDIVILVIAGDEGMMPQTEEAIKHAKQAKVPIVVAINKCDKPTFNVEQVYRQLAEHDLLPETWGGSIITVNCSAITGEGIPTLLEMILLQAEILELKANPNTRARGTVLESQLHRGLGSVANVLIQNGTLKVGDALVFEDIYGRVKTIHDEYGKLISEAGPSRPVKITGLSGIPEAGCEFIVVDNEKTARAICESRLAGQERTRTFGRKPKRELDTLLQRTKELSEKKVLNLILRADVQGSLEALKNSLLNLPSEKVQLNFVSENVGQISESDIELAAASNAAIIGFHTSVESHAVEDIVRHQIVVKSHDIIYQLINDVRQLMIDKLDKVRVETEVAHAVVKAIFKSSHLGLIAGCQVAEGTIKRNHAVKLERDKKIIWEGQISSLKRNKDDVKEVAKGFECGILLEKFSDVHEGDIIRAYDISYHIQELL
jgi:translation initiation factor IF-2